VNETVEPGRDNEDERSLRGLQRALDAGGVEQAGVVAGGRRCARPAGFVATRLGHAFRACHLHRHYGEGGGDGSGGRAAGAGVTWVPTQGARGVRGAAVLGEEGAQGGGDQGRGFFGEEVAGGQGLAADVDGVFLPDAERVVAAADEALAAP
jgi:hypothetical protein